MAKAEYQLWNTQRQDRLARWMFIASAVLSIGAGTVAIAECDYAVGALGIGAALAGAAGALASDAAAKIRDERHNNETVWAAQDAARSNEGF
jgi:hypothetical protein